MIVSTWLRQKLPLRATWPTVARELGLLGTSISKVRNTALGVEVALRLTPPTTYAVIERSADALAVAYGAARVRVQPSVSRADRVSVLIDFTRDIGNVVFPDFLHPVGLPLDPMRSFALGIDDNGGVASGSFYGHHILVGGIPGSGKSNALRVFLAHLAASRDVSLFGIDPKRVELTLWQDRLDGLVLGNDAEETIDLLEALHVEITRRTTYLSTTRSATLPVSEQFPWTVLVVDEWAELAAGGSTKERSRADELLRRYVSLGRAVGCTAILCTQRPTNDVIDIGTRTLLNDRFALRCGDRHQAEAILSAGTFQPGDLIGTNVGRTLWSDGGPSRAFQFYEVTDERLPSLVCPGYK